MSIFDRVEVSVPGSNYFDLSHDHKLTTNFGKLVPFYAEEIEND